MTSLDSAPRDVPQSRLVHAALKGTLRLDALDDDDCARIDDLVSRGVLQTEARDGHTMVRLSAATAYALDI